MGPHASRCHYMRYPEEKSDDGGIVFRISAMLYNVQRGHVAGSSAVRLSARRLGRRGRRFKSFLPD